MSLSRFLNDLFESGRVCVSTPPLLEVEPEIDRILVSAERTAALNLAGAAPAFSLAAAKWASLVLCRACQFVVCRDVDAKAIEVGLQEPCPTTRSPQTDYSVDLLFQFLPDLIRMTRAIASGDPLLQRLLALARAWPLSSVGAPDLGPVDVSSFIEHPALRQLYADRIISCADTSRLGHRLVDAALRDSLGAFPELCHPIAGLLAVESKL